MKQKIIIFLIGFLSFSSFLSYFTTRVLGMPCLLEAFAIPLLYYYRKQLYVPTIEFIYVVLFVLLGTFIGLLNPVYELSEIIPIARCFLIGAISFVICKNNNIFSNVDNLYIFCFGAFCGDLTNAYLLISTILGTKYDREYAVDINIIFSVLWVILTILYKKPKYLLAIFVLVPTLSFISVSRGVTTFFLIGILIAFIMKIIKRPTKIVLVLGFLTFAFVFLSNLYYNNEETVRKFSPSMHFRLYTKVKTYGENKIDGGRIAPYYWAANNITYYSFPRGFLGKKFLKSLGGDNTPLMSPWDSAYMELLYTFGFIPFIIILGIALYKLFKCFMYYIKTGEPIFAALTAIMVTMFIEHFFTYGLIRSPFTIASSWGVLGFVWRVANNPDSLVGTIIKTSDDKD